MASTTTSKVTGDAAKTTAQRAKTQGAKRPEDHKDAPSTDLKALRDEAAEGDSVVEYDGEFYTLHMKAFQDRLADDYEFMEQVSAGSIPEIAGEILSDEDRDKLKESLRDSDTGRVSTIAFSKAVGELMQAGGLGN